MEGGYLALDALQAHVELVFRQILEHVVTHDVTCYELGRVGINGDAGVVAELLLLVELLEGHALRRYGGHDTRRHDIVSLDVVQLHYVLDHLVFGVVQHALLLAYVGHGTYLLAGNSGVGLVVRNGAAQLEDEPYQGVHDYYQQVHELGQPEQVFPVGSAYSLGNYLGKYQYEYGHEGAYDAEPVVSGEHGGLMADGGGAKGIGYGVEGKNGGQGAVRLGLELQETGGVAVSFFLLHCYI